MSRILAAIFVSTIVIVFSASIIVTAGTIIWRLLP